MWLRNFDLACATGLIGGATFPSAPGAVAGEDGYNRVHTRDGLWYNLAYNTLLPAQLPYQGYMQSVTASKTSTGFCFGTGTTPPTYDDTNLEHYLDGTFTYGASTNTVTYDAENKKFVRTITADFLNSSGADVTVSEIGNGGWINLGSYGTYLLMREVLEVPVTVPAGEYLRVTLSYEVGAYPSKPTVTAATV